ncbi:expressed unknown protein [Seminavis robusta]|uniref:Uncharacterized protein n=1 Tax=Seminavis robusta TaxID=568900 RepID=A0A9N8HNP3_9STRA|nr:expressed unknown protein [Seminavis robusta]|eukprot:Sro1102_g241530.1 n/a (292) ;mRNA; r:8478-9353
MINTLAKSVAPLLVTLALLVFGPNFSSAQGLGSACTCQFRDFLDVLTDEASIGTAKPDNHLDPYTPNSQYDSDIWFTSVYYGEELANPTVTYRFCEHQRTFTVFTPDSYASPSCNVVLSDTPECSEWKSKQIPDETNFRIFRHLVGTGSEIPLEDMVTEVDAVCGTSCPNVPIGAHPYDTGFVFAYSKAGTVCFHHGRVGCQESQRDVCEAYFECDSRTSASDTDTTSCFSLEDPNQVHRLVMFEMASDDQSAVEDVIYVEIQFGSNDDPIQIPVAPAGTTKSIRRNGDNR